MNLTTIFFDLDGTLLPMDQAHFVKRYLSLLAEAAAPRGYEPQKLIDCVWAGTAAMIQNDGHCSNQTAFWNTFTHQYGQAALEDKPFFDAFYAHEFQQAKDACGFSPAAATAIAALKQAGYSLVLATNPIFPAVATQSRIRWAGLQPEDFLLYTTYEDFSFCKPNLAYYRQILTQLSLEPSQCLMVGNDVQEDMVAAELGMQVFLLTDCLIDRCNTDLSQYPHGSFSALLQWLNV